MHKMELSGESPEMSHQPKQFRQRVIELAARWYVFWFLNVHGLGKILGGQFYRRGCLPEDVAKTLLGDANAFDLAWTFMGYSFAYILFIGLAEIVGAWLLLWERTKLFGVAILLPVMVNIVVFDIIFLDTHGATASATIYTLLLFVILFCNRESVVQALRAFVPQAQPTHMPLKQKAKRAMLAVVLMGLLFAFDQMLVNLFGHGRG
jgi:hypothetical protein